MKPILEFSWIAIVLWIGVYQTLITIPVFWFKQKGNRIANRLLSGFLTLSIIRMLALIILFSEYRLMLNSVPPLIVDLVFLYSLFYYFYLKAFTEKEFRFRNKHLLHLIPMVLAMVATAIYNFDMDLPNLEKLKKFPQRPPIFFIIKGLCYGIHQSIYIGLGIRRVYRFNKHVRSSSSFENPELIRWLIFLAALFLLPVLSNVLTALFFGPPATSPYPGIGISLMVSILTITALAQPEILQGLPESLKVEEEEELEPQRYVSSSLAIDQKQKIHQQLQTHMSEVKPYLNQNLTLAELAQKLGINSKYLSQVINEMEEQNFMDYINKHRIDRAKELLIHPAYQHLTILAIAQEIGFKSKSAFYNAFKKFTGMTPTSYKSQTEKFLS